MTAFDRLTAQIATEGMHNHRSSKHSDVLSAELLADLVAECSVLRQQLESGTVITAYNWDPSGGRGRGRDLVVGPRGTDGSPIASQVRMAFAHKTVITAHRNTGNRVKELLEVFSAVREQSRDAVLVATLSLGTALRYLNVPDKVKPMYYRTGKSGYFDTSVLPRVGSGDESLWRDFPWAVSHNKPDDAAKSFRKARDLPHRNSTQVGFDAVLVAPLHIDNVSPPRVDRDCSWATTFDADYRACLSRVSEIYKQRWG